VCAQALSKQFAWEALCFRGLWEDEKLQKLAAPPAPSHQADWFIIEKLFRNQRDLFFRIAPIYLFDLGGDIILLGLGTK